MVNDEFNEVGTRSIDNKKRITLGDLIRNYKRVRIYLNKKGEILLMPVVEIPISELWLYNDKEVLNSVLKGLKDTENGKISKLDINKL